MVTGLAVYMNGLRVGTLYRRSTGAHEFSYDKSWLDRPECRPISLSLPIKSSPYQGKEVINFFDNLLPDNPQIRDRIVRRFDAKSNQPFDLLEKIGRDAAGALTLLPENLELPNHKQIVAKSLTDNEFAEILQGYRRQAPLGMLPEETDFRISVAGAQEKTALLYHQGQWQLPQGLTPTTHILKLPLGKLQTAKHQLDLRDSVDNEWLCLALARAFGLNAARAEIIQVKGMRVLAVERFDRQLSRDGIYYLRLPHEDFCQAFGLPPAQKYEEDGGLGIAEIMKKLEQSANNQDRADFLRSQVLFYLLAAPDGHAKNFSLKIEAEGRYRLAPLYDILSVYPVLGGKGWHTTDIRLAMSLKSTKRGKKWHWDKIRAEHYLATAKAVDFSQEMMRQIIVEMCEQAETAVNIVSNNLPDGINEKVRDGIFNGVLRAAKKLKQTL